MDPADIEMVEATLRLLLRALQHARQTVETFETDLDRLIVLLDHLLSLLDA